MSQRLPIGEYQWIPEEEIEQKFNTKDYQQRVSSILNLKSESDVGFIFEVDLHYPSKLHDIHNDYPFCPEKRIIPGITTCEKLLLTFYDKEKYVVHYEMLKLALQHGLVLKKVHRVLQFKQSAWLKPYIDLNSKLRAEATNNFEKDFYKLLNNAIYGKMLENLRLRTDIRLVNKWHGRAGARNLIAQPNFKNCKVFDEDLVAIEMNRTNILMNRPIIVGMSILDVSKVLMYSFLYNYLKRKYDKNVSVVYTDTDSFILEIKTPDVYADIRDDPDMFDTWDYPENNIYGIKRHNKKVIGKFSDELNGTVISEVVGLRSKCYSVRTTGRIDKIKRAKGVKKGVLKNTVSFDDYYKCIKNNCIEMRKQFTIRSKNHDVYTISTQKIALNPFDDKRYIIKPNGLNTLAWGHQRLSPEIMTREYKNMLENTQRVRELMK